MEQREAYPKEVEGVMEQREAYPKEVEAAE